MIAVPASLSFAAANPDPISAQEHMIRGADYFDGGEFRAALKEWSLALELFRSAGNRIGESTAHYHKGSTYLALGDNWNAERTLQRALKLATDANEPRLVMGVTGSLANAYIQLGRTEEGQQLLEAVISMARGLGDMESMATELNNLGNLRAFRQQYHEASINYRRSLEIARRSRLDVLAANAAVNVARALYESGKNDQVKTALDTAREYVGKLPPSHAKAYALISMGKLYIRLNDIFPGSELTGSDALRGAVESAQQTNDRRALSYALGYLGQLYEKNKRYEQGLDLTRRARDAAQQAGAPESLYQWQWQVGRLLRSTGETGPAVAAYRQAVYTLQSLRQDLSNGGFAGRGSFRDTFGPIFLEYADLLLEHSETYTDTEFIEGSLREVRETVELLKGAELEDYFQDDCVAALKEKTAGIDKLASHTAAIYPIIFEDRLELLLSLPEGLKRFTSSVTADTLVHEVRQLRRRLEKRTTHQYMPHAKRIYDWIIRPLEPVLQKHGIDTLVIVPDGALRTIPMAALHDGKHFLIHRYAIATTPGLTLTDPRPLLRSKMDFLLGGLTDSVQGFPPLPNVKEELESIQEMYGGEVLKNQTFVIPNLEKALIRTPYSIVHLASHGQFDQDVNNTFLLTYDGKLSMDALDQYLGISKYRKDPVELLTLSACQTAAGDDRAALGLAGIAIKAGARSALATLWYINDRASSILVSQFYKNLQDASISKAMALRQAQLRLLNDRRYRHPGYWSPFLLIGNWL